MDPEVAYLEKAISAQVLIFSNRISKLSLFVVVNDIGCTD
jgi:hypothetical protein